MNRAFGLLIFMDVCTEYPRLLLYLTHCVDMLLRGSTFPVLSCRVLVMVVSAIMISFYHCPSVDDIAQLAVQKTTLRESQCANVQ
jgi:hypothetical protein